MKHVQGVKNNWNKDIGESLFLLDLGLSSNLPWHMIRRIKVNQILYKFGDILGSGFGSTFKWRKGIRGIFMHLRAPFLEIIRQQKASYSVELQYDCLIYIVHSAGTGMIVQHTDCVSRESLKEGVLRGEDMALFDLINKTALDTYPHMKKWIVLWDPRKWISLIP
eukprot:9241036-Ditylum_brightwellii.AAC.1